MLLNKITSDIRRPRRGLELCGLASLQNKERQFCVFLPEKGFPACNFRSDRFEQAAQIIVRLFSFCWFRNRTTKSVRGIMNSDPGNQDVQPRTLPAFFGVGLRQRSGTAVYLASRASDFVTGTTIRVDGGYAIR